MLLLLILSLPLLAGCLGGGDGEDPDAGAIAETATAAPASATATASPTAVPASTATLEPSATPAATSTATPSPTPRPQVRPQATPTPIVIHTPTAGPSPASDLVAILPRAEDHLPGLVTVAEGGQSLDDIAADAEDAAARAARLEEWGFQQAAYREYELPAEQLTDPDNQLQAAIAVAIQLGSPESAALEMQTHRDEIVLADPDASMSLVEVAPLGDSWSAASGTTENPERGTLAIGVVWVTAGPLSLRFLAASGTQYDPLPDLVRLARATLANLGLSGAPPEGEILLETDFSDWYTGSLDPGEIFIAGDGSYHLLVTSGGGSFISAYSTGHEPFTDFSVSVELRRVSGEPEAEACVLARVDQINQQYDYALCIDGSGAIAALYEQFDPEGNYSSEPLLDEGAVSAAPPDDWTALKIIVRGEELWFFVNGELVHTAHHIGPPGGAVGVIVNNFSASPAEFAFRKLAVRAVG